MMTRCKTVLALLAILFLVGCVGMQTAVKGYSEMTPKEKSGFVMRLYNNAADEYRWLYKTKAPGEGSWSTSDKEFLEKYRMSLAKAHGVIKLYDSWVTAGTQPTMEMEDDLILLIRTLSLMAERRDL
jgi:hypothetical protein